MRFIMGMIAVVALLVLAVVFVGMMALNPSAPTLGMVALPLEQLYEKATSTLLPPVMVAVVVTIMAVGTILITNRALRSSDTSIQSVNKRRVRFSLKFPHVSGQDDKSH